MSDNYDKMTKAELVALLKQKEKNNKEFVEGLLEHASPYEGPSTFQITALAVDHEILKPNTYEITVKFEINGWLDDESEVLHYFSSGPMYPAEIPGFRNHNDDYEVYPDEVTIK